VRKKHTLLLAALAVVILALTVTMSAGVLHPWPASAANGTLLIKEDTAAGHITIETPVIKAVWHYKTLPTESYNQGGGNLYELYYKPMDPGLKQNLISFATYGNERSTPLWAGIGGVGSTAMYAVDIPPASSQTNSFSDIISDNNLSGTLKFYAVTTDDQGNAVLTFVYQMHNQSTGKEWYQVTKRWTVEPGGVIHLNVDWSLLASGYFSEIAVRSNWSYNVGWTHFSKYGRDWLASDSPGYLVGSNIENVTAECWDDLNRFHPDWIAFTGSPLAPTVKMSADNNGLGFRGGGLYQLGVTTWASPASSTGEQCSILGGVQGAHTISWMSWWGGNPPLGNRYRWLNAGTAWSDSFRIDLTQGPPGGGPDISTVEGQVVDGGTVRVSWLTDVDSDSLVELKTAGDTWTVGGFDGSLTRSHSVLVQGLAPGTSYNYRVKSRDSDGNLAMSSGYQLKVPGSRGSPLVLSKQSGRWKSYADYENRILTVDFNVSNQSGAPVDAVSVTSVAASGGVEAKSILPILLGSIPTGGSVTFPVAYRVPPGISLFSTWLTGSGTDANGVVFKLFVNR
jgi:hypothetical protein